MVSCWSVGFEHLFLVLFLTLILIASKYFCYAWCDYVHTMSLYQMQFCNPLHGLWKYTYWLTDCTTNALDLVQRERDRVFDTNTIVCVWHLHLIFCVCVLRRCTSLRFTSPQTHTHTHTHTLPPQQSWWGINSVALFDHASAAPLLALFYPQSPGASSCSHTHWHVQLSCPAFMSFLWQ